MNDVKYLAAGGKTDERVYFMVSGGLIKIGWTSDIDARWTQLNRAAPAPVEYLGSFRGSRNDEHILHQRFKHLRRRGEWFEDAPALRAAIETIIASDSDNCLCGGRFARRRGRFGDLRTKWIDECDECLRARTQSPGESRE